MYMHIRIQETDLAEMDGSRLMREIDREVLFMGLIGMGFGFLLGMIVTTLCFMMNEVCFVCMPPTLVHFTHTHTQNVVMQIRFRNKECMLRVCLCIFVCMYLYMYVHVYIHVCMYMYT
jgi:hypothetical protein